MDDIFFNQNQSDDDFGYDQPLDNFNPWRSIDDYDEYQKSDKFLDDPEDFQQDFF
jgi:hypothetical protein